MICRVESAALSVRRDPVRWPEFFSGRRGKALQRRYGRGILENFTVQVAGVAQSAEHRFCKPRVESSSLSASSAQPMAGEASGLLPAVGNVRERTGNGWIPKRPKGPDCKSGGNAFAGSNPAPPMSIPMGMELDSVTRRVVTPAGIEID